MKKSLPAIPANPEAKASPAFSWANALGPCVRKANLDVELRDNPGLMWMTTSDGVEICPQKQFVLDTSGKRQLIPAVAAAWQMIRSIAEQRGDGCDSTMLRFIAPMAESQDGKSMFDILSDPAVSIEEKQHLLASRVADQLHGAIWEGSEITDPRITLGRAASHQTIE